MPIISDMEIIKSAIIYGDLDDAMSLVNRKIKSLGYSLKRKPSVKISEYSTFLTSLKELLEGKLSLNQFRGSVDNLQTLKEELDLTGDSSEMMNSLYYLLEYSLDRYNVKFPNYEGKRCDDK